MKANFRIVALAVAALALTVACKHKPEEVETDTLPAIDTTVIDTLPEEPAPDTVVIVKTVEKAPAKQKSKVEQVVEDVNTVKKATLETKKDVQQVIGELKQDESNTAKPASVAPGKKKNAADAFKKN